MSALPPPFGEEGTGSAKVTNIGSFTFNDRHDRHENPTPLQQRQQRPLHRAETPISPENSASGRSTPVSHRPLRRTPRFVGTPSPKPQESPPRRTHLEAVTIGFKPEPLFAVVDPNEAPVPRPRSDKRRRPARKLSQDLLSEPLDDASTTVPPSFVPPRTSSRRADRTGTHPFVHISKHTHSAILWALEEALRYPNPFTPDLIEENASMADIRVVGGQPTVTNGVSSPQTRPTAPPMQTGSPSRGIRGPKAIMEERRAREERQRRAERADREEQQQRLESERMHAEAEARELEQAQRRLAEQRQAAGAAHAAPKPAVDDSSANIPIQPIESSTQRRQPSQQGAPSQTQQQPTSRTQQPTQSQARPSRTTGPQQPQQPQFTGVPNVAAPGAQAPTTQPGDASGNARGQPRNTFPHAFERWEALSAHWEGLTSFWIRKLQQHADEIDRDPVSSQLSRQVSDLSAAGANLFHAVVELQRLRASSERKFQRWFFETRAELERNEETKAGLERALAEERRSKAAAIQEALENDRSNSKTQKRIVEMQKELIISKEEARRAWEELGRREQEERDRTISLQQGLPTIVGGVQVVPMTQGVPNRGGNAQEQRQGQQPEAASPQEYPQYTQPQKGSAATAPAPSGGYYQQPQGASGEEERPYSAEGGSEGGFSEGEYLIDAHGNFIRDSRGDRIPYPGTPEGDESDHGTEEYETPMAQPGVSYPPSASHQWSGQPDYSGSGYAAPGWETMPRHHHPTRLSDVIEEDETRSRTSASQSQVGRHQ